MKVLLVVFIIGASVALKCTGEGTNDKCRHDCLYLNFDYLILRYTNVDQLSRCLHGISESKDVYKSAYNLLDYGRDMHTNMAYTKECYRYETDYTHLRVCQKPILELVEMGAQRMLKFFNQLRQDIKVDGNATQIACVNAFTALPIRQFQDALKC